MRLFSGSGSELAAAPLAAAAAVAQRCPGSSSSRTRARAAPHLRLIAAAAAAAVVPALLFGHQVSQAHELLLLVRAQQLCEAAALAPGTAEPRVQLVVHLAAAADAQWGPSGEAGVN